MTASGEPVVLTARCPHMGADLALGDIVEDQIRCTYHHFCFGTDGRCTKIPSEGPIPSAARVHSYPAAERFGMIWAYHGNQPRFGPLTIRDYEEDDLVFHARRTNVFTIAPWLTIGNTFDFMHLRYVHDLDFKIEPEEVRYLDDHHIELDIPFVASGGMADARSLVASLAMGAEGMNMGTRFIATQEAPVHENVKKAIVAASELDTRLVMRPLRNTERVMTNDAVERLLEKERKLGADLKFEDIIEEVAGVYPRIMSEGDMDAGAWSCGMVAGLISDIPTCQELIDRIMSEAEAIIRQRLAGFLDA